MVSVEINGSKRLLVISAAGHVSKEEVKQTAKQVCNALQDVAPGLRALIDFRWLESMRPSAASHIAEIEALDRLTGQNAELAERN